MYVNQVIAIFGKEVRDSFRDRRSMVSALMFAFFGPLLLAGLLGALAKQMDVEGDVSAHVAGGERAPSLVAYLQQQGVTVLDPPADTELAVENEDVDFVVVIPDDFGDDWRGMVPARIEMHFDSTRNSGTVGRKRVEQWLQQWASQVASQRLMLRGVDPRLMAPLKVEHVDYATPEARGVEILGSLPMFFLMATFICAMNVAIDVTAGERERGSLEFLLTHSVPTSALAVGKWMAAVVFNIVGVVAMLVISVLVLKPERFEGMGVQVQFGFNEAVGVLAIMAPLVLMAPALQMVLSIFAKSFKEAQTYLSLMMFVPMMPGFLLMVEALEIEPWMHVLPILGQQIQILDLMSGAAVGSTDFFLAAGGTLMLTGFLVWWVGVLFGREKIVLASG